MYDFDVSRDLTQKPGKDVFTGCILHSFAQCLTVASLCSVVVCSVVIALRAVHQAVVVVHASISQILREQFGNIPETVQSPSACA